ncbi:MAG: hypothetical protein CMH57_00475 [Myxococcales bacterium]|nr:hypothetical protein [Myxococcales bacterium]
MIGTATVIASGIVACDAGSPPIPEANGPKKATTPAPVDKAAEEAATRKAAEEAAAKKAAEEEAAKKAAAEARAAKMGPGRVVQVTHPGATEDIKKTNEEVVKKMVSKALTEFTGDDDPVKAIARFFKKEDVVGIKVNCLGSPYATVHPATAFALADTLHAMGIPKNNIYIYDQYGSRMRKAGFKLTRKKVDEDEYHVQYHGTLGYEKGKTEHAGHFKNKKPGSSQFPRLLDKLTAVLNVCCVKDHDLTGITGALKNVSYGNVERVPIFHCQPDCNPNCCQDAPINGKEMGGLCNVSRIYTHPKMGGLVKLVVCDALRVLYQGGPQDNMTYKKAHNALLVSTDPVAIDRAILEIVNGYRAERGLKSIEKDQGGRRAPRFLEAANKLGLGEHKLDKIKWEKVNMT